MATTLKLSEFRAERDSAIPDPDIYTAVVRALRPPSAYHSQQDKVAVVSVLNKITATNFEKLSPGIMQAAEADPKGVAAKVLAQAERQPTAVPLMARLLADLPGAKEASREFARGIGGVAGELTVLVLPSPDEEYERFCEVGKRKVALTAAGAMLGALCENGLVTPEDGEGALVALTSCARGATPYGLECLIECVGAVGKAAPSWRRAAAEHLKGLWPHLEEASFKLRFAYEKAMEEATRPSSDGKNRG